MSNDQRRLMVSAIAMVPTIQASLRHRGFRRTMNGLAVRSHRTAVDTSLVDIRALANAVAPLVGRPLIGGTCLGRSLVVWYLLRRRGIDAELVIGADACRDGVLNAHAWVEVDGVPVNEDLNVRTRFGSFGLQLPRLQPAAG